MWHDSRFQPALLSTEYSALCKLMVNHVICIIILSGCVTLQYIGQIVELEMEDSPYLLFF